MANWNDQGAGGGYFGDTMGTPSTETKAKTAARQQFLCPVTIRQLHEAPEDGLRVGNFTATTVTLVGVVINVVTSSTSITFTLSDDTGTIDCIDWLETEENDVKNTTSLMEENYYQVFGCIKSPQGSRRVMVFKVEPIESFNAYAAFMVEVLSVNHLAQKKNFGSDMTMDVTPQQQFGQVSYGNTAIDDKMKLTQQQKDVLAAISTVDGPIGWNKNDPNLRKKYTPQQIDTVLEHLVGEGYIYSTVDDDHYSRT